MWPQETVMIWLILTLWYPAAKAQYLHEVLSMTAEVDWDMAGCTSLLSSSICLLISSLSATIAPSSPDVTFSTSETPPSESDGSSSTPPTWPLEREKRENRIPPIPFPRLAAPEAQKDSSCNYSFQYSSVIGADLCICLWVPKLREGMSDFDNFPFCWNENSYKMCSNHFK